MSGGTNHNDVQFLLGGDMSKTRQRAKWEHSFFSAVALVALAAGCEPGAKVGPRVGSTSRAVTSDPDGGGAGCTSSGTPAIAPDKDDYFPPETVTLTASGLECGAMYSVRFTTPTQLWPVYVAGGDVINLPAQTADASGGAVFTWDITQEYNGNVPVELLDAAGNVVATTDFHDSHFRFGTVSWVPSGTRTAKFSISTAWRRSYPWPQGTNLQVGQQFNGGGSDFYFGDGASIAPVYTVQAIDPVNDWIVGTTTVTHTYASNGPFTAQISNCCRLSTLANNHDGNFQIQTTVNFNFTNSSPVTTIQPIVNAPVNSPNFHFTVPSTDPDHDNINCRLATCLEAYGDPTAGCVAAPAGLTVNASNCQVSWDTTGKTVNSVYTAQVMLEDRRGNVNGGNPLSKVPVDFILQIVATDTNPPVCSLLNLVPTPASSTSNTATFNVSPGTAIGFQVRGTDADAVDTVTLNSSGLWSGATMTPTLPISGNSPRNSTFAWTPVASDGGTSKTVNFTVTDQVNQQATCTVIINVDAPPTAQCVNVSKPVDATCHAVVTPQEVGGTSFDSDGTISSLSLNPSGPFSLGATPVTLTATDNANLTATCQATVTAFDNTAPAISCTAGRSVLTSAQNGACSASLAVSATATDNCDASVATSCDKSSLTLTAPGTASATCSAHDASGNAAAPCTTTLTLVDDTIPTLTCAAPQTVRTSQQGGACTAQTAVSAAMVDNCDGASTAACDVATLQLSGPGTTSTSCHGHDASGNTAAPCSTSLTLVDDTAPSVVCAAPVTSECTGNGAAQVNVANATASDTCGSVTIIGPAGANPYPLGTTSIAFTARDGSGNQASCSTSVTVVDTTRPTISCPAPTTSECTGNHSASVNVPNATASDICGPVVIAGPAGTNTYPLGTTAISFSATDPSGNVAGCASSVTVADTTPPQIACPAGITAECTGNSAATVDVPSASGSDLCGGVSITDPAPASYPLGTTTVAQTATDDSGNRSSCSSTVTVTDTTPPSISCPAPATAECTGNGAATVNVANATGSDICSSVTILGPAGASSYPLGTTSIAFTARDTSGNQTSCSSSVTVHDTTPPSIACPPPTTAECTGNGAALVDVPNAIGSDICGGVTVSGPAGTNAYPLGTTAIAFSAMDGSGNQASCSSSVVVVDTTPPSIACPAPMTAECTGNSSATVDVPNASGDDICGAVFISGPAGANSYPLGTTSIAFTAVDGSGNLASCGSSVTIVDTTPPSISCPAPIVAECTGNGAASVNVPNATAADICGAVTVAGPAGSSSYPLGTTSLAFTATDAVGQQASCSSSVTVRDTTPPVLTSPGDQTLDGNCTGAALNYAKPTATDVCATATVSCPTLAGNSYGANTITCTATDPSGNTSSVSFTVTVLQPLTIVADPPLRDGADNVAQRGSTVPVKVHLLNCAGTDVTTTVAVTVRLGVTLQSGTGGTLDNVVPTYNGAGSTGGIMVLTDSHYQYNLNTKGYQTTASDARYYQLAVSVNYTASPSVVVGTDAIMLDTR